MPDRRPLVVVGGVESELPTGDRLAFLLPAIAAGQPRTFEQDDPGSVVELICNCVMISGAAFAPYTGASIGTGGTTAAGNGATIDANRPCAIKIKSGTVTNSGARVVTETVIKLVRPTSCSIWVNFNLLTNSTFRIGLHTSITVSPPTDGCYWEIINGAITAKITNNGVSSQLVGTPPVPTLGATDWYRFDVIVTPDVVNAANSTAQFVMRDKNLASLFSETLTGANISTTRLTGAGIIATNSGTVSSDLCHIHQLLTRITGISR